MGRFDRGVMVSAAPASVSSADFSSDPLVPVPVFQFSSFPPQSKLVGYSRSTRDSVGENPTVPDPYEQRTVYLVINSSIFSGRDYNKLAKILYRVRLPSLAPETVFSPGRI